MNFFCNIVYVYIYISKICEKKFGGCLWSFSWLGQSNPVVWHPHCVCDSQFQRIHWTTVSVLWPIQSVTKRQLNDTVFPCTVATTV